MELADPKQIPELNLIQDVSLNGVKVLLAEDNELNAELAITLLEEAGMHVTRAVDGQDAVACFANNPADTYDVILMDVLMPKMNGHQAARAIRAMSKERPDAAKNSNHRTICKCFQGRCTGILGFWNERTHFKAIQYRYSDHCNKTKYKEIED